ncbi:hypothetical protein [Aestuariivivens insulae]|uniref:hypothetical protein n=1 Tax=Aestuariivivens insulae TaxID=1621988 RepID=UPI001F578E9C|nr:hypothetical protein [Aestuariivivens insulae]
MKNFKNNLEVLSEEELVNITGGYIRDRILFLFNVAKDGWDAGRAFVRWANSL